MRNILSLLLLFVALSSIAQKVDSISIPKGVRYKYCKPEVLEKAKQLLIKELGEKPKYKIIGDMTFVGPGLWARYKKIKPFTSIEGGNLVLMVDDDKLYGKLAQSQKDGIKFWDQVRKEVAGKEYTLRKATEAELNYYWAIISFDIEEPLIIIETTEHRYLVNFNAKDMTILWLDEAPAK
jgi:hypothetical protein